MTDAVGGSPVLPRELAPGVFWFGQCMTLPHMNVMLHLYNSAYLVVGDSASLLFETGPPADLGAMERQMDQVLDRGAAPVKYIVPSHPETNHAGGLGRLLARFPEAEVVGDPTDVHLYQPDAVARLRDLPAGAPLDLGGRMFKWVPSVFRDHRSTRWGFDTGSRALFSSDGLAYTHYHLAGHCGHTVEECGDLDVPGMVALFSEAAFPWTRVVGLKPYVERLDQLFEQLQVSIVAPTHGLPIVDLPATMTKIRAGMLRDTGAERSRSAVTS
jgi:flavorubredoxin